MAPRRTAAVLRAVTLVLLLSCSSCWPLSHAATTSTPTPAPAPAPLISSPPPPPRPNATSTASPVPAPPRRKGHHRDGGAHGPPPAPESRPSWWQRLNLGQKVGLALAAVAIAMQVVFVAFLAARARKLSRAADRAWERRELSPARPSIGGF